jgi:hypothetical protein
MPNVALLFGIIATFMPGFSISEAFINLAIVCLALECNNINRRMK